jgi:uncharacterized delta-60 repeat protein
MKIRYFLLALSLSMLGQQPVAQAQSPQIDPGFLPAAVYGNAPAQGALQLRSGAHIVAGNFLRADGEPTSETGTSLLRYLPSGAPDAAFNATLAADRFFLTTMAEAANGKLLLGMYRGGTFGGQGVPMVVQLNDNGTVDPTFTAPATLVNGPMANLLVQADGKIVVGGDLANPTTPIVPSLVRLNTNGTLDASFQARLTTGRIVATRGIVQQPDGKLLVGAYIARGTSNNGEWQLVRLQADGTQDPTFQLTVVGGLPLAAFALQPDGQILIAGYGSGVLSGNPRNLVRVSATGVPDASFTPLASLTLSPFGMLPPLVVQPDGRILLLVYGATPTAGHSLVTRLLPSGAFDTSWNVPGLLADNNKYANSLQLLPSGEVLLAGYLQRLGLASGHERSVALLTATGQPTVPAFDPHVQTAGFVFDVAQQPDGRLVATGIFSEVSGTEVSNIVRFQPDGTIDTAFCRRARLAGGTGMAIVVQPDGTVLVGGSFHTVNGAARPGLARLLPTGQLDATFAPPLLGLSTTNVTPSSISALARQADGRLLVVGTLQSTPNGIPAYFLRLNPGGAIDASFQPPANTLPQALLVQPDGTIMIGLNDGATLLRRLLPSGAADPVFTPPAFTATLGSASVQALDRYPDGRLLVAGKFTDVGGVTTTNLARLQANGAVDASFATQLFGADGYVETIALQPNGRVLLAGRPTGLPAPATGGLYRLLPDGSVDASFDSSLGPLLGVQLVGAMRVLVQTDGAIVAGGLFTSVGGLPIISFTRLLDPNVLHVQAGQVATQLQAWPVPAHETLQVSWAASTPARRVQLLDNLGRAVQTVAQPTPGLRLATAGLAPGVYLLRVDYANGNPALRRIVVE